MDHRSRDPAAESEESLTRIRLMRDGLFAPCCFVIVKEVRGKFDIFDEANTVLVQLDYDFPGVAQTFGATLLSFVPGLCDHDGTDGTIRCPECGTSAGDFIEGARAWLIENEGAEANDPGYFS